MLGIDIGNYSVKVAVSRKSGRKSVIDKVAMQPLPIEMRGGVADVVTLQQITSQLFKRLKIKDARVALSVPTSSTILKTLMLDSSLSGDMLEGEVQLELVNFVPFPLEQVYADYVSLGKSKEDKSRQEVFVAVSRKDIVDKVANSVDAKFIKKKQVDVAAFCVGQVIEQLHGKNDQAYGIIDIGYRSSNVYVFKDGEMLFSREQQVGGNHLTEAIADALGFDLEQAESMKLSNINAVPSSVLESYYDLISEQVMLALEFFNTTSNQTLEKIYLTGGGSKVDALPDALAENLPGRSFSQLPLTGRVKSPRFLHGITQDEVGVFMATAVGLSMRT